MAEVIFNQSGGELRIQDGASGSETWKQGPRFQEEFVLGEKKPGIGLIIFFPSDSRINLHTCKSNEKQLNLLKKIPCPICK